MTEPLKHLERAVCSYKSRIEEISELRKETVACLNEIQSIIKLNRKKELAELKALQLPESELTNRPCILFIGSQNCGKSTLLNVFLKKSSLLPTDETPCTSRIVRIVYSSKNQTKFEDPKTNLERIKSFKNKVPEDLVVLRGEARNDSSQLQVIIEVGLSHPLLECGIELIDSPGRNENEALDRVVEEFIEKGIVPLIVYVVDGNYHLRDKDRTTIRELQDKFPNVSLMFVCSKVDVDKNAKWYDDDEDEDCKDGRDESQEMFDRARHKKIAVFKELKSLDFLPPEEQMDSSELFHGLSAKLVKKARKKKQKNQATMNFERFELCILEKLESSLRKKSKRELAALLTAQEMFLASVVGTQQNLSLAAREIEKDYKHAKEAEEAIFTMIEQLINNGDSIINTIGHDLEKLSAIFLQEAQDYQYTAKCANKAALVKEFSHNLKGSILDRTFNVLKRSFQRILKKSLVDSVILNELSKSINPLLRRMLHRTLGGNERHIHLEDDKVSGIAIFMVLDRVIDSVNDDVDILLRNEIKSQLEKVSISQVGNSPRPHDSLWRRKAVQTLLANINIKHLADEVIRTCERALWRKRQHFKADINAMTFLNTVLSDANLGPKLDDIRTKYVPLVAHLAVRGHSLRYVIERGPPELGPQFKATAHGHLFCCTSPLWGSSEDSVVKRVKRDNVGQEVWSQTMRDCMHLKDINDKLCGQHPNLLELRGWYFPEPDQLYIVMEKAECDLLTALKGGLSWKRRKEVAVDVARGLEAIHNVNYVYQDLKPQNVMLTANGTAKINFCKPEKPFETTQIGLPFHISPEMFVNHPKGFGSSTAYDIYAFGSLLWVLCEGTGTNRPQRYSNCEDIEAIKFAVCDRGFKPERPTETPEAWWELMSLCWTGVNDIKVVLDGLLKLHTPNGS